jgi:hypothetical protein
VANLGETFDANEVEPSPFELMPPGPYQAVITDSSMKTTNFGDGSYLQLDVQIVDGAYKGRKLIDRLNLHNPNTQAVDIARQTLSSICRAVGVMRVTDSSQLHGRRMVINVKVEPGKNGYSDSNRIKSYAPLAGGAPPAGPDPAPPQGVKNGQAAAQSRPVSRKPWVAPPMPKDFMEASDSIGDDEIPF